MPLWTFNQLAQVLGCPQAKADFAVTGFDNDSRALQQGNVFIALKGVRDGHDFVEAAQQAGAAAALVEHAVPCSLPQLVVPNVEEALRTIGQAARERNSGLRFGITGSVGKTSTKELLATAVGTNTHKSEKSYNNQWGVPLTLARMPAEAAFGVFEMGMNHAGEIAPLTRQVLPHVAIITNVGTAHIGNLGSVEAIAAEKLSIAQGLGADGVLVLPLGVVTRFPQLLPSGCRLLTFSMAEPADAVLKTAQSLPEGGMRCTAQVLGKELHFNLALNGEHHALNAVAVLLAVAAAGLNVEDAAKNLVTLQPIEGRGQVHKVNGVTVVDESYNANSASMIAALKSFQAMPCTGKRWALLGDMRELGAESHSMHAALAPHCRGLDGVVCVGVDMKALYDALPESMTHLYVPAATEIDYNRLQALFEAGDSVLVKGSKGSIFIYNVVGKLCEALARAQRKTG